MKPTDYIFATICGILTGICVHQYQKIKQMQKRLEIQQDSIEIMNNYIIEVQNDRNTTENAVSGTPEDYTGGRKV